MGKSIEKAYWFKHDCNAKDDPKIMLVIDELGSEGFGIFWILIETLRLEKDYKYPLKLLGSLARKYNTTAQKMEVVVRNYGLFEIVENEFFLSQSLCRRMKEYDEKIKKLSLNARKGALKRKIKAEEQAEKLSALDSQKQLQSKREAFAKREEKRKKEKKISLFFKNLSEFKNYVLDTKEGYEFYLNYPNPFGYLKETKFKIRDGYLYNCVSKKDLEVKEAIEMWHYLYQNQHILLKGNEDATK